MTAPVGEAGTKSEATPSRVPPGCRRSCRSNTCSIRSRSLCTPSCTATRTSPSSTVRATPRSWSTRRPASASPPWPSPTTTASTASSASPWRPRPSASPRVFGAELTLELPGPAPGLVPHGHAGRRRPARRAPARARARARSATHASRVRSAPGSSRGRRARRASRSSRWPPTPAPRCTSPARARRPSNDSWFVLTGCRKGSVVRALLADGPAAARRNLDRLVAAFGRDRVLVELWDHGDPLDRHRNDALAEVAVARRRRRRRDQQRALRDVEPAPACDRARRGAGPPLSRRARRLAPRRGPRAPAQPGRAAAPLRRAGPARSSAPSTSRASAPSTCASPRRTSPTSTSRPATPTCRGCASSRGGAQRGATRSRTRSTSRRSTRSSTSCR